MAISYLSALDIDSGITTAASSTIAGATFTSGLAMGSNDITLTGNIGRDGHNYITFATDDQIVIRVADTHRLKLNSAGLLPYADSSYDLGATGLRYANLWVDSINGSTPTTGTVTSVGYTHAGNAFTVGGSPVTSAGTLAVTMAGTSSQFIDGAGTLTNLSTLPQGDITGVTAGSGLTGGGTSGAVTLNVGAGKLIDVDADDVSVDLTLLTDMTAPWVTGSDEFVVLDGGTAQRRKLSSEIFGSNAFNSSTIYAEPGIFSGGGTPTLASGVTAAEIRSLIGAGTSSTSGTVTSVATGAGLSGGTITATGTLILDVESSTTTATSSNADWFSIANTAGTTYKIAPASIMLSTMDNDSGWTSNSGDITGVTAGSGLTGGGSSGTVTLNVSYAGTDNVIFDATDASGTDIDNDDRIMYSDFDGSTVRYGKVSDLPSSGGTVTSVATGDGLSGGTITGSGTLTVDSTVVRTSGTQTIAGAKTFSSVPTIGTTSTVDDSTLAASTAWVKNQGYSTASGDITGVTAGTLLTGGGTSGTVTLNVDLAELSTSTANGAGDYFAVIDTANAQRKLTKANINLSGMNNDSGWTTNTGTLTSLVAGAGISGGTITSTGTITLDVESSATTTLAGDADWFSVANTAGTTKKIAPGDIDLSTMDNVSGWTSNSGDITGVTAGTGLSGGGTTGTVTLNLANTAVSAGSYTATALTVDAQGRITAISSGSPGDITGVTAGSGLTGGGTSGTVTLNVGAGALIDVSADAIDVDLSEATDMTAAMVGTDEFIVLDSSAQRRKAANEIGLSIFSNDSGFTTNTGTVTSSGITAGAGISVSGSPITSSGNITVTNTITNNNQLTNGAGYTTNTGTTTASNTQTFTNKSGNISQWTNNSGYVTTNTTYSAGTALDLSGTTFNVDLSELSTSTTNGDGDYFVVTDTSSAQRKLTKANIALSGMNNDSGWTSNSGDITGVTAGSGISGGGTSGTVTITNSAPNIVQTTITGNAGSATKLITARTIAGVSFNGTANISLNNNAITNGAGYTTNTGTTTASNSQTFTNKGGNVSQWTNDAGYLTSTPGGDITGVTAGTGLSGGGTSGTVTLNLDLGELGVGGTLVATDYLIAENGGVDNRQLVSSIPLSIFSNNAGWTTNSGTVTSVAASAGAGITISGSPITTSGTLTITNSAPNIVQTTITGNAGSATVLQTARTIAGVSFNGSANISLNNNAITNGAGYTTNTGTGTMSSWTIKEGNGVETSTVSNGETVTFAQGTGIESELTSTTSGGTLTITNTAPNIVQTTITGNAGTATKLQTARNIAGVSFNGTANISLNNNAITNGAGYITSYVNTTYTAGSGLSLVGTVFANTSPNIVQTTITGNAGTATLLQTARTISGTSFNGGANITLNNSSITNGAGYTTNTGTTTASNSQTFTNKSGNNSQWTNDSGYTTASGTMSSWTIKEGNGTESTSVTNGETLTIAQGTGITSEMTSTSSGGTITITNTAPNVTQTTITGNAGSATVLQTARTISGTSFNGSANITLNNSSITNGAGYTTNTGTTTASNSQTFTNKLGNISMWSNNAGYTTNSGDITAVTAGTGMSGGGTSGAVTLTCTITNNNQLTNGAGYTTSTGDITSVTAGTGMSGGGTTGAVTLTNAGVTSIVAGTGIDISGATGAVTVSTEQDIDTAADVRFDSFGVGTNASGTTGMIRATNNIYAYYSDERLKDFEGNIPNALDKVCQLGGYYFRENELAKELGYDNNERQVGVNAQEVEKIMPEVVHIAPISDTEAAKGVEYKTVSYDKLVPLLIESIKELKAEIDELKKS
jgi:hypothetical protein